MNKRTLGIMLIGISLVSTNLFAACSQEDATELTVSFISQTGDTEVLETGVTKLNGVNTVFYVAEVDIPGRSTPLRFGGYSQVVKNNKGNCEFIDGPTGGSLNPYTYRK